MSQINKALFCSHIVTKSTFKLTICNYYVAECFSWKDEKTPIKLNFIGANDGCYNAIFTVLLAVFTKYTDF